MATIRSLAQLFDWFKRGAYPKAEQFQDAFTSFWHKEENIPQDTVKGLPDSLNGKFDKTDGEALIDRADALDVRADGLESRINTNSTKISAAEGRIDDAEERLDGHDDALAEHNTRISTAESEIVSLHATDAGLRTDLTGAQTDISAIREMIKGGATLDEAKAALIALGDNYKDVHAIGGTLKAFLEAADTADTTINTWKEIEHFLDGITDTESLTGLLEQLEMKITAAYKEAVASCVDLTSAQIIPGAKTFSTQIVSTSQNILRSVAGNYGVIVRNDGSNTNFLLTDSGDQYGTYNSLRPLRINNSTGAVSSDSSWTLASLNATTLTVAGATTLKGAVAIPEPTEDQHAATKSYVDSSIPTKTSQLTNDSDFVASSKFVVLTQAEYDALAIKDSSVFYFIEE